ncbi:unnamed protein product [Larinioides sclopetarius]|uniref:Uncharacterized protein n=1 Tax=Larinioides sclopetarius TaxID=280406 RepID=A0AAV2AMT6_9ARAC
MALKERHITLAQDVQICLDGPVDASPSSDRLCPKLLGSWVKAASKIISFKR